MTFLMSASSLPTPKLSANVPWITFTTFASLILSTVLVRPTNGLRLTNMSVPIVADIRDEMSLDCRFDMGAEDLYAVKWYKDDQEFFRYIPDRRPDTISFPVAGVHLVARGTSCGQSHCSVRLKGLTRDHSGGAYRCEISSEAPTFRLASETRNVTVAALPLEEPRIEGLAKSYVEGEAVSLKCISPPSDPAPILSWYINNRQAPSKLVGEMTSSDADVRGLVARSLSLRFQAERKYSQGSGINLRCDSSLPGIPHPPQSTTEIVPLKTQPPQVINNQKWQSRATSTAGTRMNHTFFLLLLLSAIRCCINSTLFTTIL